MTEYDYSPEAYERYMATQTRISNWIDTVSQSMHTPSPSSRQSYDSHHHPHQPQYQRHSRPTYPQHYPQQYPQQNTHSNTHSQPHSRSNSLNRNHSRTRHQQHYQEPPRPRSHSQTGSRPQAVHSHSVPPPPPPPPHQPPMHSRAYSYAMNQPPQPAPIPVPQPAPYPNLAPRRSRTLPPQSHNVVYHTYEGGPRGSPTYVIVPPVIGGGPHGQQLRMQSPVTQTKRAQPLLKRLFTSFGPWGSSSGASPKSKFAPARRYPRRSSF